jgi:HlyD family secretion protein
MNQKRSPIPAIVIVLVLIAISVYFFVSQAQGAKNGALTASGTVETVTVNIAPELAGKITEVLAEEGQSVSAGSTLLSLDPSLLTAQRDVAVSAVDSARTALAAIQNNYNLALQNAVIAQSTSTAKDWRYSAPDEFNQPAWYFLSPEQITSAQTEVDAAQAALDVARSELQTTISDLNNADFLTAEKRLADARAAFLVADEVKAQSDYAAADSGTLTDIAYDAYKIADDELRIAQREYNALLNTASAEAVLDARGKVRVSQQRYDVAYSQLVALQSGADSPTVVTAQKALDQAAVAVQQAEANLSLLDAQIAKLTVSAPTDGVILTRNVEPGEFVQPGATALVLGRLSNLTITVYVPEDHYGEISLGQSATMMVDSFKNMTFQATVVNIADNAEFTPRNVQTVEGRSSTVYAIKLKVEDPDGVLKPGMPADVIFSR